MTITVPKTKKSRLHNFAIDFTNNKLSIKTTNR